MQLECEINAPAAVTSNPKTLHVLTLTPFYPNSKNEVSGCFIAEPLKLIEEMGVEHSVFAAQSLYQGKASPDAKNPAQWARYFSLPGGLGLSSAGAFLFANLISRVRSLHQRKPIDLIHAHATLPCGHAAMLLAQQLGIPFVVTVHGLDAYYMNQVRGKAGEWCRRISRRVFGSAAQVICISDSVRHHVLEHANQHFSTSVIYNGVDADFFVPAHETTSTKILSIGNLIPIKGHELLFRAIAKIQSRIPNISCEVIGEGPERSRLQMLAERLNIADKVRFAGRKNRTAVANSLRDCTVFALPSRYEALGCVYLEAMAAAKPVIACHGQGIAEIIEHGKNGWLIAPDRPEDLAAGLFALLENADLRNRMRLAARRTILKSLTLRHQAQHLTNLYRECAA